MSHWKTWLLVAVAAVVLEVLPPATHFFFLCVAFGALAAAIVSFFAISSWPAWVVFVAVTAALTPVLIPLARFLFARRQQAFDLDALQNRKATVRETLGAKQYGTVVLDGELWRAYSESDTFQPGEDVLVSKAEKDHLIVRRPS